MEIHDIIVSDPENLRTSMEVAASRLIRGQMRGFVERRVPPGRTVRDAYTIKSVVVQIELERLPAGDIEP